MVPQNRHMLDVMAVPSTPPLILATLLCPTWRPSYAASTAVAGSIHPKTLQEYPTWPLSSAASTAAAGSGACGAGTSARSSGCQEPWPGFGAVHSRCAGALLPLPGTCTTHGAQVAESFVGSMLAQWESMHIVRVTVSWDLSGSPKHVLSLPVHCATDGRSVAPLHDVL